VRTYLVGGAVRDQLLGLPVRERDWVVVGAEEQELLARGFRRLNADFPVFLHPQTGDEYALARTERKIGPGYTGFAVDAGPQVTLEQDLRRRDLTINALALDEAGELVDPLGGREDLDAGLLRHITPAFVEDPVRLLRIARFAARLGRWGFRVAHGTHKLLCQMAGGDDLAALQPERLWREMELALAEEQPWRFFEVLHGCGALARLIPELARRLGEPGAHRSRGFPEPLAALRRAAEAGAGTASRFAVLFQGALEAAELESFCRRLRGERGHCDLLADLVRFGPQLRTGSGPEAQLALLEQARALTDPARFRRLLEAAELAWPEAAPGLTGLARARELAAAVSGRALAVAGLRGPELGRALRRQRLAALAEAYDGE
jgi:tRNA nucleotidyltransferase (CCA-adding enzyme)